MTPLDIATAVFLKHHDGLTVNPALERACLAYVSALAEDEATVERVARIFDPQAFRDKWHPELRGDLNSRKTQARKKAKSALRTLSTPEG